MEDSYDEEEEAQPEHAKPEETKQDSNRPDGKECQEEEQKRPKTPLIEELPRSTQSKEI